MHAERTASGIDQMENQEADDLLLEPDVRRRQKIQRHILGFDKQLIKSLFGNREARFKGFYKNQFNGTFDLDDSNEERRKKTFGKRGSSLKRDKKQKPTVGNAGYDSDEEKDNAHRMFIDDLQLLRQVFIQTVDEQVRI